MDLSSRGDRREGHTNSMQKRSLLAPWLGYGRFRRGRRLGAVMRRRPNLAKCFAPIVGMILTTVKKLARLMAYGLEPTTVVVFPQCCGVRLYIASDDAQEYRDQQHHHRDSTARPLGVGKIVRSAKHFVYRTLQYLSIKQASEADSRKREKRLQKVARRGVARGRARRVALLTEGKCAVCNAELLAGTRVRQAGGNHETWDRLFKTKGNARSGRPLKDTYTAVACVQHVALFVGLPHPRTGRSWVRCGVPLRGALNVGFDVLGISHLYRLPRRGARPARARLRKG